MFNEEVRTAILLREWADRALAAVDISSQSNDSFTATYGDDTLSWPADIRRTLALSSDSYLTPALKVARLLANRVCGLGEGDGGYERLKLPDAGDDWAGCVLVVLSDDPVELYDGDLQPLPTSFKDPSPDPRELQDMLNAIIPDDSLFAKEENHVDVTRDDSDATKRDGPISFCNVASVELLPFEADSSVRYVNGEMHAIYCLGVLFYELFSGERYHGNDSPKQDNSSSSDVNGEGNKPSPQCDAFNLSHRLKIVDDIACVENLLEGLTDNQPVENESSHSHPKKKGQKTGREIVRPVSVEPLQQKGLPTRLCDLILNMLDSIKGDLSREETYRSMSDVCTDLQLMFDKPGRHLHDIDLNKAAKDGLQLDEALFQREMELSSLQNSYRRAISGENECAMIVGPSGIGKSSLAYRLDRYVSANGGLFLSGKFDQLKYAQRPFSALSAAFGEYCDKMKHGGRSSNLQAVASKLRLTLGQEALHLVNVIPNLSIILGDNAGGGSVDQGCVDGQKRLQFLLCQFVCVISSFSGAPIVLFLDDLQWADEASTGAIHQLLMRSRSSYPDSQFFFLGSSREEKMLDPFGTMLSSISQFIHTRTVKLSCMDKGMTNSMVSDLLCLSPRLTSKLTEIIFHKTKGNPLFFAQLMMSLYRDGSIRLSLNRRRWEWEEEVIQSRKLPDDIASCLSSSLEKLPQDTQAALSTLACLGNSTDFALVDAIETKLGRILVGPLEVAVAEGILNKTDRSYIFGHDRLQEVAYNMLPPEDRPLKHFKFGVILVPRALELKDDQMLFCAASQINRGGPSAVQDADQALLIVHLNLSAGQKAESMSDFSSAYSFYDNGISFLREGHWQDQYDLSLQLYEAACKCALVIGDVVALRLLSEQIRVFARSFEDQLNSMYYIVTALCYSSQLPAAVARCTLVLSELGESLPEAWSASEIKVCAEHTISILNGFNSDEDLIDYKLMNDPQKLMAMKFYARLETAFIMIEPSAQPIVTMKMVQLSIAHGMSPISPLGFTYLGHFVAKLGDIREGCRYVTIGKKLLDKLGSKQVAGEVIAMGTQILSFLQPIQSTLESHIEGHNAAMTAGDVYSALLNDLLLLPMLVLSGRSLPDCRTKFSETMRLMAEHHHYTFLSQISNMGKNVARLMGTDDTSISEIQSLQDVKDNNQHAALVMHFQAMYIHYVFREYNQTKDAAEKYFSFNLQNWTLLYFHTSHVFYGGLVACWLYRETGHQVWAERARTNLFAMKKWGEQNEWNFQHRVYLIEAEEVSSHDDSPGAAEMLYEEAIASARKHRFVNEEALAHELAGYFYIKMGKKEKALERFMQAHEKYHIWGAIAKAGALFGSVKGFFGVLDTSKSISSHAGTNRFTEDKNARKRMPECRGQG